MDIISVHILDTPVPHQHLDIRPSDIRPIDIKHKHSANRPSIL